MLFVGVIWQAFGRTKIEAGFSHLIGIVALIIAVADILLWKSMQIDVNSMDKNQQTEFVNAKIFEKNDQILVGTMIMLSIFGVLLCMFGVLKASAGAVCAFFMIIAVQAFIINGRIAKDMFFICPLPFLAITYWDLNQGYQFVSDLFFLTLLCLVCIEYLIMFFLYWRSLWHSFETLYRTRLKKVVRGLEWLEFVIEKVLWLFWVILGAYFIWHYLVGSYLVISFFTSTGEGLFSYFAVSEYKNFLRFSLDGGNLTVFPIGILTPLQDSWKCAFDNATASFFATTGNASSILNNTFLIESPFQL
jgi:hypothetical protein